MWGNVCRVSFSHVSGALPCAWVKPFLVIVVIVFFFFFFFFSYYDYLISFLGWEGAAVSCDRWEMCVAAGSETQGRRKRRRRRRQHRHMFLIWRLKHYFWLKSNVLFTFLLDIRSLFMFLFLISSILAWDTSFWCLLRNPGFVVGGRKI